MHSIVLLLSSTFLALSNPIKMTPINWITNWTIYQQTMVLWNLWTNGYAYDISTLGNCSTTQTNEQWTSEQAHMNKKKNWRIFHVMSWNIPNIFVCYMEILYDMVEYSMTCHGIFYDVTCMVCSRINNGLLTLNMGLANRTIKSSIIWRFEGKRK